MPADLLPPKVFLLGPQRREPSLRTTVDGAGIQGSLAAVTAGWEEREDDDLELDEHLGGRLVNLRVFHHVEQVYERDPELHEASLGRHATLTQLQDLHRLRLAPTLQAARELLARQDDPALLEDEQADAIEAVRRLDARHLARVAEVHDEFEQRWKPIEREAVQEARDAIAAALAPTEALCIAGGHVGILHNRMRLLDVLGLSGDRPVFAWSGGAMLLSERIVLFHDSPPQGPGDAEVFGPGLGLCPGVVVLPHVQHRLRLEDATRVALFARRFAPSLCAAFDGTARLDWDGKTLRAGAGTRRLASRGAVIEIEAA